MFEKAEGTAQVVAGRIQDTVDAATGDASAQVEGKARQVAGKAQQTYGDALNQIRECAVTNPLATIAVAGGIGVLIGALLARR